MACSMDMSVAPSNGMNIKVNDAIDGIYINKTNEKSFVVSGTCTVDDQPVKITGAVNAEALCLNENWTVTMDLSSLPDGEVKLLIDHVDEYGNKAITESKTYIKDTVLPIVAISAPNAETYLNNLQVGSVSVSGACSEDSHPVVITGAVSGHEFACSNGEWSGVLDFSQAPEGPISFVASQKDTAGNPV
ncbi:MAG: hypothetical protein RJB66_71 [Pseudomonadota bacterium]